MAKKQYNLKPDELCHAGPDFHVAKKTHVPGQMYVPKTVHNCMDWAGEHEHGQEYPAKSSERTDEGRHDGKHKDGMHMKHEKSHSAMSVGGPKGPHRGKHHSSY